MKVAFSSDSNYVIPATVAITSFLENNKESRIEIYLLYIDGALQETDLTKLKNKVESYQALFFPLMVDKKVLMEMPVLRHGLSTYLRILLPQLLPEIDKILYLDVDLIVERSLLDLYNMDLTGYQLAAVPDLETLVPDFLASIGFKRDGFYFCAGILLMNLKELRKIDLVEKTKDYILKYGDKIVHSDQDILNCICTRIKYLSPKYNLIKAYYVHPKCNLLWSKEDIKEAQQTPCIIHYLGAIKPWMYLSTHPKKKNWYKYLVKTEYLDYIPIDKTVYNYFCLQLMMIKEFSLLVKVRRFLGKLKRRYNL